MNINATPPVRDGSLTSVHQAPKRPRRHIGAGLT